MPWEQNGTLVNPTTPGTGADQGKYEPFFMEDSSIVDKETYDQVPEVE